MPILNTATIHFFIQNQLKFRPSRTINLFATMASADFCRLMYHHFARLNLRLPQTSLGKVNIFQSIAAASTTYALASKPAECVLDVGEMCHLIRHKQPLMQFLFVSTDLCSPAYFSAWVAPNHLAAC